MELYRKERGTKSNQFVFVKKITWFQIILTSALSWFCLQCNSHFNFKIVEKNVSTSYNAETKNIVFHISLQFFRKMRRGEKETFEPRALVRTCLSTNILTHDSGIAQSFLLYVRSSH